MNVFAIAIAFAAGIAFDATYQHIRRENEYQAFKDGYQQAQKEENMRKEANERGKFEERFNCRMTTYATDNNPKYAPKVAKVPESFMKDLHDNGRAVVRIK